MSSEEDISKAPWRQAGHRSLSGYLKAHCIDLATSVVRYRLKHGYSWEEAITLPRKAGLKRSALSSSKMVCYRGETLSLTELFKRFGNHCGISYALLSYRLRHGWSVQNAIETPPSKRKPEPVSVVLSDGREMPSIAAAVREVGSECSPHLVAVRIRKGASFQEAVERPVDRGASGGIVYLISNRLNGKAYVGITRTPLRQRWASHLSQAERGRGSEESLSAAIRSQPSGTFDVSLIDEASEVDELCELERRWVTELGTLRPHGYNSQEALGTGLASGGKSTEVDGVTYPSLEEAARVVAEEYSYPVHVARRRLVAGLALDIPARSVSHHPLAGSKVYRIWNGNRARFERGEGSPFAREWLDFQTWYDDFGHLWQPGSEMVRLDLTRGFEPGNVAWMSKKNKMHHVHGRAIVIAGREFASVTEACDKLGVVSRSTASERMRLGWDPADAVTTPLDQQRASQAIFVPELGAAFDSVTAAAKAAQRKLGMDFERARYRLRARGSLSGKDCAREVTVGGTTFRSEAAAARAYGVKPVTYYGRRRKGWSLRQSLGLTPPPARPPQPPAHNRLSIVIGEKTFVSQAALAEVLGVSAATVSRYRKSGRLDELIQRTGSDRHSDVFKDGDGYRGG